MNSVLMDSTDETWNQKIFSVFGTTAEKQKLAKIRINLTLYVS